MCAYDIPSYILHVGTRLAPHHTENYETPHNLQFCTKNKDTPLDNKAPIMIEDMVSTWCVSESTTPKFPA